MRTLLAILLFLSACTQKQASPTQVYYFKTYYKGELKDTFSMQVKQSGSEIELASPFTTWTGTVNNGNVVVKSSSGIEATGETDGENIVIRYWDFEERGIKQ